MMNSQLNRLEILKLLSVSGLMAATQGFMVPPEQGAASSTRDNILIFVFDAFSSRHLPVYGYQRETTPNISRFAERATVYHNHYAGGTFTTPGTASLLTGTYPFTHRATGISTTIFFDHKKENIFRLFNQYYRIAATHNPNAQVILQQIEKDIDQLPARQSLLLNQSIFGGTLLSNDIDISSLTWERILGKSLDKYNSSLFLSHLGLEKLNSSLKGYEKSYPRGLPESLMSNEYFLLEYAVNWVNSTLQSLPQPYLGYFHFLPPHAPYNTRSDYIDHFRDDGYQAVEKPEDIFSEGFSHDQLNKSRRLYDEFILYADDEFGRLYQFLEDSGITENSWIILTSDHGEMFERGIEKHMNPSMFEPIVRVPLMISAPGQLVREDVYSATSAVDLVPTLAQVAGLSAPAWSEGTVMPPFRVDPLAEDRSIYALDAKSNSKYAPLKKYSGMLLKWPYKLIAYEGYDELENNDPRYELYHLEEDPEELINLIDTDTVQGKRMIDELQNTLKDSDRPYK